MWPSPYGCLSPLPVWPSQAPGLPVRCSPWPAGGSRRRRTGVGALAAGGHGGLGEREPDRGLLAGADGDLLRLAGRLPVAGDLGDQGVVELTAGWQGRGNEPPLRARALRRAAVDHQAGVLRQVDNDVRRGLERGLGVRGLLRAFLRPLRNVRGRRHDHAAGAAVAAEAAGAAVVAHPTGAATEAA